MKQKVRRDWHIFLKFTSDDGAMWPLSECNLDVKRKDPQSSRPTASEMRFLRSILKIMQCRQDWTDRVEWMHKNGIRKQILIL